MQRVLLRFAGYTLAVFLAMVLLVAVASRLPGGLGFDRALIGISARTSELSPVELLQNLLLLFAAGSFGWVAWRDRLRRPMGISLAGVMLVCLVRELDYFLDFYVIDNLWQVLCGVLLALILVYSVRQRARFAQAWRRSWPSAGLAMIMGGFILLIPFAQLIGHGALWQGILGEDYVRVVKVAAEEFVELGAYLLIALGTTEFLYAWSRLPRKRGSSPARR